MTVELARKRRVLDGQRPIARIRLEHRRRDDEPTLRILPPFEAIERARTLAWVGLFLVGIGIAGLVTGAAWLLGWR